MEDSKKKLDTDKDEKTKVEDEARIGRICHGEWTGALVGVEGGGRKKIKEGGGRDGRRGQTGKLGEET